MDIMGEKYAECQRSQGHLDGKIDGCQEFQTPRYGFNCEVCGCHRNFHRKVAATKVVYTKCHKIHTFGSQASVDGCQEFMPDGDDGTDWALICANCGCKKAFHRNLITT